MLLKLFRKRVEEGVEHGDVDVLSLPCSQAVEQGRIDGAQRLQGSRGIGNGRSHVERPLELRLVLQVGLLVTALGLHHRGIGGPLGGGPGLAVTRNRAHDQRRVGLRQGRIIQPQPRHDTGTEVLDDNVVGADQPLDDVDRGSVLEIKGQAFLAAVQLAVDRADALPHRRHVAGELPIRRLDLQHLGPHIRHQPRAVRPGDNRSKIQHPNPVQHARAGQLPVWLHGDLSLCGRLFKIKDLPASSLLSIQVATCCVGLEGPVCLPGCKTFGQKRAPPKHRKLSAVQHEAIESLCPLQFPCL